MDDLGDPQASSSQLNDGGQRQTGEAQPRSLPVLDPRSSASGRPEPGPTSVRHAPDVLSETAESELDTTRHHQ